MKHVNKAKQEDKKKNQIKNGLGVDQKTLVELKAAAPVQACCSSLLLRGGQCPGLVPHSEHRPHAQNPFQEQISQFESVEDYIFRLLIVVPLHGQRDAYAVKGTNPQ